MFDQLIQKMILEGQIHEVRTTRKPARRVSRPAAIAVVLGACAALAPALARRP